MDSGCVSNQGTFVSALTISSFPLVLTPQSPVLPLSCEQGCVGQMGVGDPRHHSQQLPRALNTPRILELTLRASAVAGGSF